MTELLQRVIAAIEHLPADAQDAIAARLLEDMEDEQAWTARFEATTDAQWDRMAAIVHRAIAAEEVEPLEDAFPSDSPA
jgi:predicted GTPase